MNTSLNKIHKSVIIEGNVSMGTNNTIEPNVLIRGPLNIGSDNYIGYGSVIGTAGENTRDPHNTADNMPIRIGNGCIIKENVVIHKPCFANITLIGDNVFLMQGSHIAHDCIIQNDAVVTPNSVLGGIVTVCAGANIALGCVIHQYSVIGHYSITAMGSAVTKNVKPFSRYIPNQEASVNLYAVKKFGFESFLNEITDYVLKDRYPVSKNILDIIDEFDMLHKKSGRNMY